MSWFLYHILIKSIKDTIKKTSCDEWSLSTNCSMSTYMYLILLIFPVNLHLLFEYQVDVDVIIWCHTQTSKLIEAYLILPQNTRWITVRGLYLILLHIPRVYFNWVGKFLVHVAQGRKGYTFEKYMIHNGLLCTCTTWMCTHLIFF